MLFNLRIRSEGLRRFAYLAILSGITPQFATAQEAPPPAPAAVAPGADAVAGEEGAEILTRGPVHEAFAVTVSFDPQPGIEVAKEPPEVIEELPPDQKPEGDNVAWIPGYWAWDDDREDYLWVSGVWRALPPGRQWVPGYWGQSSGGFQWISGYWAGADQEEIEYLPQPPEPLEEGPNVEAESADQVWVPGSWVWHQNRYVWRPGYWVVAQQNWIWTPACYVWAPNGYVFVDGYWDYSVARRGVLFAPVYFQPNFYQRQGFVYSPITVINVNVFSNQLFLRPNYHHYYFGDYYATNYTTAGFYPWFSVQTRGFGYDPFFAHQRWMNRGNPRWAQTLQADFKFRVDNEDARPPRTFAAQQTRFKGGRGADEKNLLVAMSLDQAADGKLMVADGSKAGSAPMKLRKVEKAEREKFAQQGQQVQKFRAQRRTSELKVAKADGAASPDEPGKNAPGEKSTEKGARTEKSAGARSKLKLDKSPIVAQQADANAEADAPPKSPDVPKFDEKVEPKTRKPGSTARTPGRNPRPDGSKTNPDATTDNPSDKPKPGTKEKMDPREPRKPGAKPEPKPETKPETTPEKKPRPMPTPKSETNPDPKPMTSPKTEPKPDPKPMPAPKVEPKPEPKPRPEPKPKAEPKPEPKPNPEPKPKAEPKPERQPMPKPAPRSEPRLERKPKPMPKPNPEPEKEPKA